MPAPDVDAAGSKIRLLAIGVGGTVVEGVRVFSVAGRPRMLSTDLALGETDAQGGLVLDRDSLLGDRIAAVHPDYLPLEAQVPDADEGGDEPIVLRLEPGEIARVSCFDPDGAPLEGVSVFLSPEPIGRGEPLGAVASAEQWCAVSPASGIFASKTDARGTAVLGGLPRGPLRTRLVSDTHEIVDGQSPTLELPGPELGVLMAPMFCMVLRLPKGVLYSQVNFEPMRGLIHFRPGRRNQIELMNRLIMSNPGASVAVVSSREGLSGPWPLVHAELRARGREARRFSFLLNPVSEGCSVVEIGLDELGEDAAEWCSVTFRIVSPLGEEVPVPDLCLQLDPLDSEVLVPIRAGVQTELPPGTYRLVSRDVFLAGSYHPSELTIDELSGSHVVTLDRFYRRCRFVVVDDSGEGAGRGLLDISCEGRRKALVDRSDPIQWLPVGLIEYRALYPGCRPAAGTFAVPRGDPSEPVEIPIVVEREGGRGTRASFAPPAGR